jgi:hypothetical protein
VTQGLEIGSSSGQDSQKSLEKTNVLTLKENNALPNSPRNQTKAQIEYFFKKVQETLPSTPDKSTTNIVGKQPGMILRMENYFKM